MEGVIANIMPLWQSPSIHSVGNFQLCFLQEGEEKQKESTEQKVHSSFELQYFVGYPNNT